MLDSKYQKALIELSREKDLLIFKLKSEIERLNATIKRLDERLELSERVTKL